MRSPRYVLGAAALCLVTLQASRGVPGDGAGDTLALSQSLAAAEQHSGTSHPDLLAILAPLAQSCFRDADITEAKAFRRRALKIAIDAGGSDSVSAADAMLALA